LHLIHCYCTIKWFEFSVSNKHFKLISKLYFVKRFFIVYFLLDFNFAIHFHYYRLAELKIDYIILLSFKLFFLFVSIIMYYLLYNFLLTEAVKKSIRNISFLGLNFYLTFIYFPKCLSINCFFLDSSQQNTPKCTKHVDEHVNWRRISLCKYSHQEQTALWVRCPYRLSDFSTTLFNKVNQTHAEYIL